MVNKALLTPHKTIDCADVAQYISFNLTLPKQLCRCVSLDPLKQYPDVDFDPPNNIRIWILTPPPKKK